jgi:hypothetical protein
MDKLKPVFEGLGHDEESAAYYAKSDDANRMVVRSAFLHMLWSLVIDEDSHVAGEPRWIEEWLRGARRDGEPPTGVAAAVQRVMDKGVDSEDLTDIVRAQQYEIIYNVCQLLDGEWLGHLREQLPDLPPFSWRLYEVAEDENYEVTPVRPIDGLHEQLGEVDPADREGEPRSR